MVESGDVILTPSKRVEGKSIVPYDDRYAIEDPSNIILMHPLLTKTKKRKKLFQGLFII